MIEFYHYTAFSVNRFIDSIDTQFIPSVSYLQLPGSADAAPLFRSFGPDHQKLLIWLTEYGFSRSHSSEKKIDQESRKSLFPYHWKNDSLRFPGRTQKTLIHDRN